jgi:hypothetical protein
MTLEIDFLLAAVRRFFRPESPLPSKEGLDWDVVLQLADRHAVAGFLRNACDPPALADGGFERARSSLELSAELVKLVDLFKEDGIDVIPLKGPVLGTALYQDRALKASTDLDLLVRRSDALRAKRLLESVPYCLLTVPHWPAEKACLRDINDELAFRAASSSVCVTRSGENRH